MLCAFKRPEQLEFLEQRRLPIPPYGAAYSVNRGLWGVTIGGKETLTPDGSIPDSAFRKIPPIGPTAARAAFRTTRLDCG